MFIDVYDLSVRKAKQHQKMVASQHLFYSDSRALIIKPHCNGVTSLQLPYINSKLNFIVFKDKKLNANPIKNPYISMVINRIIASEKA